MSEAMLELNKRVDFLNLKVKELEYLVSVMQSTYDEIIKIRKIESERHQSVSDRLERIDEKLDFWRRSLR